MKLLHATAFALVFGFAGCAVTPAQPSLQGAEWRIEDIAGTGVIDSSNVTLQFLDAGRLAGSGGCNRLLGSYDNPAKGDIKFSQVGTTMMACPPALMNQERKLLDLLPTITRYSMDASGALVLSSEKGEQVLARR